jgi:hypothetical protein
VLNSTLELVGMDSSVLALCSTPSPSLDFISLFTFALSITPQRVCVLVCALMQLPSGSHHHLPVMGLEQWIGVVLVRAELAVP